MRLERPKVVAWTVILLVFLAGCGGAEPESRVGEAQTATESIWQYADGETGVDEQIADDAFASPQSASGGTEGATDGIRSVSTRAFEEFDWAIIEFGTRGEVASRVPVWALRSSEEGGYVRIFLPGVNSTMTTEGDFVGRVLDQYYVVRNPEGGLFVDIFLLDDFSYRVTELSDQGRLAVDFQREEGELESPVVKGETVVVLQPKEAEVVSSPLSVSGYSRNFEASNTVTLLGSDGSLIASENVRANDWAEAWGYFETSLEAPDYEGWATLRVGSESPRDGAFEGVEVPLYLRSDQVVARRRKRQRGLQMFLNGFFTENLLSFARRET